jgi:hypothetical protein
MSRHLDEAHCVERMRCGAGHEQRGDLANGAKRSDERSHCKGDSGHGAQGHEPSLPAILRAAGIWRHGAEFEAI